MNDARSAVALAAAPAHAEGDLRLVSNHAFDEIAIADSASIEHPLTEADFQLSAVLSGDVNPQHLNPDFAAATRFHGVLAHEMWGGAL